MVQVVLRAQLRAMCGLRKAALKFEDIEGVHDMRVLSRRLRSAITDFKPFLRKSNLLELQLKAIAKALGAVRDEDVALIGLKDLKAKATGSAADGIALLGKESENRQSEARLALTEVLSNDAISDFRKELLTRIDGVTLKSRSRSRTAPDFSFGNLGAEVLKMRLDEMVAAGSVIYSPFEVKQLHELRILAKRLRYSLELFADCWEADLVAIAKEVALLQTSLGELHDCDMWIEKLSERLQKAPEEKEPTEESNQLRDGATWLLKHFTKERMEHYRDALARWQEWGASGFLETLKSTITVH